MTKKSFVFSSEDSDSLDRLGRMWRLENSSSVLRVSLAVFEDLSDFLAKGNQVIVRSPKGEERLYQPLMARDHNSVSETSVG